MESHNLKHVSPIEAWEISIIMFACPRGYTIQTGAWQLFCPCTAQMTDHWLVEIFHHLGFLVGGVAEDHRWVPHPVLFTVWTFKQHLTSHGVTTADHSNLVMQSREATVGYSPHNWVREIGLKGTHRKVGWCDMVWITVGFVLGFFGVPLGLLFAKNRFNRYQKPPIWRSYLKVKGFFLDPKRSTTAAAKLDQAKQNAGQNCWGIL